MARRPPSVALRPPPESPENLRGFPTRDLEAGADLFRVVRGRRSPRWIGNTMAGRFDLPSPEGTCYLATDPLAALLEVLGPGRRGSAVSARFLRDRRLLRLRLPKAWQASDLTSRRAARFGVTAEIGSLVPYELPQAWAAALRRAGSDGLLYWLRHDPGRSAGIALFGPQGGRSGWPPGGEEAFSTQLLERLEREYGIEVLEVPRASQLRMVEPQPERVD